MKRVSLVAATLMMMSASATLASDERLPSDISGTWTGIGKVQKNESAKPLNVKCSIDGEQSTGTIGFGGQCRALMFLKRDIGAELTVDGDRLSGVYVGSDAGPARLDGTITDPETITLNMTFEREVNGDDQAVMTIIRPDENSFTITTVDRMLSGEEVTTSQITFLRK